MNITCPRCGGPAEPAGHEDARAFFQCPACSRVWATHLSALLDRPSRASSPPRVLVADDSPEMLGLLSAWLEDEGCIVIAAGSGREALDAAIAYRPDVAFVDVILPPPDGWHLSAALTQRLAVTVVLMTGMSTPDMQRVADSGALLLLRKPFARETLVDALARALADRGHLPQANPAVAS
jgi:CheY-like chemotaxis protein